LSAGTVTFRAASLADNEALIDLKWSINKAEHAAYPANTAIPDILDLSREAAVAGVQAYWEHIKSGEGAFLVGEIDGEIVCCGCWYEEMALESTLERYRRQANIGGIVVAHSARGKGLGRAIMVALEGQIKAAGIRHARLAVVPGNTPAESLYHSLGFEDFETVMIKAL
jgi:ribosomal protein S18 acetylase RimI-like enzyme